MFAMLCQFFELSLTALLFDSLKELKTMFLFFLNVYLVLQRYAYELRSQKSTTPKKIFRASRSIEKKIIIITTTKNHDIILIFD